MPQLTKFQAWKSLQENQQELANIHMRELFSLDPQRFERFSLQLGEILFDFSKNRISEKTVALLVELARQSNLGDKITAMYSGEKINTSENRAVLHVALRNRSNRPILVDGRMLCLTSIGSFPKCEPSATGFDLRNGKDIPTSRLPM